MTTTVTYNRKLKQYELTDTAGTVLQIWPSGRENGTAARREAVRRNDRAAHDAAEHLETVALPDRPDLHSRIWRAAELVAGGHVAEPYHLVDEPNTIARVKSQNASGPQTGRSYAVALVPDVDNNLACYCCDCHDYTGTDEEPGQAPEINGRKYCKHIMAVLFHKQLQRPLQENQPTDDYDLRQILAHRRRRLDWLLRFGASFAQPASKFAAPILEVITRS